MRGAERGAGALSFTCAGSCCAGGRGGRTRGWEGKPGELGVSCVARLLRHCSRCKHYITTGALSVHAHLVPISRRCATSHLRTAARARTHLRTNLAHSCQVAGACEPRRPLCACNDPPEAPPTTSNHLFDHTAEGEGRGRGAYMDGMGRNEVCTLTHMARGRARGSTVPGKGAQTLAGT